MKKKPKKDSFSYNTDWKAADLVPSTDILGTAMIMTAVATGTAVTAGIRAGTVIMTAMTMIMMMTAAAGNLVRLPLLLG